MIENAPVCRTCGIPQSPLEPMWRWGAEGALGLVDIDEIDSDESPRYCRLCTQQRWGRPLARTVPAGRCPEGHIMIRWDSPDESPDIAWCGECRAEYRTVPNNWDGHGRLGYIERLR